MCYRANLVVLGQTVRRSTEKIGTLAFRLSRSLKQVQRHHLESGVQNSIANGTIRIFFDLYPTCDFPWVQHKIKKKFKNSSSLILTARQSVLKLILPCSGKFVFQKFLYTHRYPTHIQSLIRWYASSTSQPPKTFVNVLKKTVHFELL